MRCASSVGAWAEQPKQTSNSRMKVRLHDVTRNRLIIGDCLNYLTRGLCGAGALPPAYANTNVSLVPIRSLPSIAVPNQTNEIPSPHRSDLLEVVSSSSPSGSPQGQVSQT